MATYERGPEGVVFSAPNGGWVRVSKWRRRYWYPAVKVAGVWPLRFHDLRHTHAALLIEQGEHAKVIQSRLGHASIKTTLDAYGHLMPGLDAEVASRLDRLAPKPAPAGEVRILREASG